MNARAHIVALGAVLIFAGTAAGADRGSGAERAGVVAFEAKDGLYTVDANGGQPLLIPGTRPGDGDPRWSPDGTKLAFDRGHDDDRDIYVMNADGSGQRRLTTSPGLDNWPQWAPHGRSLAFLSERDGYRSVYAINVQTGAARRVTRYGQFPDWTQDGRIIFTGLAARNEAGVIFTIRPYGADRRPLPTQPGNALGVRVSPDGRQIVYSTRNQRVYTAAADGSRAQAIVVSENNEANDPAWSPDGQWVVYDFGPSGTVEATAEGKYPSDLYVIRADGSTEAARLTHLGACCADWRAPA